MNRYATHHGSGCQQQQQPELRMAHAAFCDILNTVGSLAPETGGILLGPVGSNDVTDFHFDDTASCSGATYSPDHESLQRKMNNEWLPAGVDMKGFCHSHPGNLDRLTSGDMAYIQRLLAANGDMDMFAAPIVIPEAFRLCPLVVLREDPRVARTAALILF